MVDVPLAPPARAVPDGVVVLIGDPISSVGRTGRAAGNLIASGAAGGDASRIFRQAAERHRARRAVTAARRPDDGGDVFFVRTEPAIARDRVVEACVERIPRSSASIPRATCVLAPMHRGEAGVAALNPRYARRSGARMARASRRQRVFRAGDKVMQVRNDYSPTSSTATSASCGGRARRGHAGRRPDGRDVLTRPTTLFLEHAWAVGAQVAGRQHPAVVLVLLAALPAASEKPHLYRRHARPKLLVVVGSPRALAAPSTIVAARHTHLAQVAGLSGASC